MEVLIFALAEFKVPTKEIQNAYSERKKNFTLLHCVRLVNQVVVAGILLAVPGFLKYGLQTGPKLMQREGVLIDHRKYFCN